MINMIRRVLLGAFAGTLGTLAMDLLWYRRYRSAGGPQPFLTWETSAGTESYETAAAPARTAKVVADFLGVELPDSSARTVNNLVHWITGVGWGKAHGTAAGILGTTSAFLGPVTGVVAWGTSYVVLPRLGVYKPMREYDTDELWQDLSAHLVYGATLGVTFRMLAGRRR
jgi:hypothetical protein